MTDSPCTLTLFSLLFRQTVVHAPLPSALVRSYTCHCPPLLPPPFLYSDTYSCSLKPPRAPLNLVTQLWSKGF
ncbi:hypothetical protein KP509_26G069600 [Ceratopteris richardii]|uniref:Secreted protein n=1 Tax=Ceratopteris richardii TaxID=49495 RepID=A0A8T2RM02_CERRI|nr:hypothetical protein KP509_26G069600 [Ceratopteris richardii]